MVKVYLVLRHPRQQFGADIQYLETATVEGVFANKDDAQIFVDTKNADTQFFKWSVQVKTVKGWSNAKARDDSAASDELTAKGKGPLPQLVRIEWRDPASDWPWFYLLKMRGEWLLLQGADYPDGSAKHDGDCFWVHKSDVRVINAEVSDANTATEGLTG